MGRVTLFYVFIEFHRQSGEIPLRRIVPMDFERKEKDMGA